MSDARGRGFAGDVSWAVVGTGAEFAASILLAIILARHFGPAVYGLLAVMTAIIDVPRMIANSALGTSFAKHLAESRAKDPGALGTGITSGFVILTLFGVLAGALVAALAEPLSTLMGRPELAPLLRVGALVVVAYALLMFVTNGEQGLGRVDRLAQARAGAGALRLVITLAIVFGLGAGLLGVAAGMVVAYGVSALVFGGLMYGEVRGSLRPPAWPRARAILLYSVPLTLTWLANFGYRRIDMILVGVFVVDPKQVSYFAVAVAVAAAPYMLMLPVGLAALPRVAALSAREDRAERARLYAQAAHTVALVYVPFTLAIIVLARPLFQVVLPQYLPAVPLVQVLCVSLVPQALATMSVGAFLTPSGKAATVARITAFAAVANIALDVVLIPRLGPMGSVLGSLLVTTAASLVTVHLAGSLLEVRREWLRWVSKPAAAAVPASAVVLLLSWLLRGHPWYILIVGGLTLVLLYLGLLSAIGGFTDNDRRLLRGMVRRG